MGPVTDRVLNAHEDLALEGVKAMKAYLAYQGHNKEFLSKAKIGAAGVTAYVRLRSSESNRMQVELIAERMSESRPKALR
jgi:hypothetical protein